MIDEKVLSVALQDLADRDETGPPPLAGLLHRGHRARTRRIARTAVVTTAALALVAGVAVTAQPTPPTPVPLALAAQTTERTTFQFRMEASIVTRDDVEVIRIVPWQGKYDPVHDRGYRRWEVPGETRAAFEERQIGPNCFVLSRPDGRWYRSTQCWRPIDSAEGAALGESASPGDLLAQLRHAGQVSYVGRTGTGTHAVDTYRFSYRVAKKDYAATKTGTVDIDVTNRRIIKVSYLVDYRDPAGDGSVPANVKVVMRFDDFGTPVDVVEPTDIVDPDSPLGPTQSEPAQSGPAQSEPAQSEPAQSEPARSGPAQHGSAQPGRG